MCVPGYLLNCTRRGTGRSNPSREPKFSGANGDREIFIFPVQLTTSRIGNLPRSVCVQTGVSVVIQYSPYSYFLSFFFVFHVCLASSSSQARIGAGKYIFSIFHVQLTTSKIGKLPRSVCVQTGVSVVLHYNTVQYSTVQSVFLVIIVIIGLND